MVLFGTLFSLRCLSAAGLLCPSTFSPVLINVHVHSDSCSLATKKNMERKEEKEEKNETQVIHINSTHFYSAPKSPPIKCCVPAARRAFMPNHNVA